MINKREQSYHAQVELLLKVLPFVAKESCFVLKGGTAINFFIRDMPRLSVDIDLTYLPIESREATLQEIENSLIRIKASILRNNPNAFVQEKRTSKNSNLNKLYVFHNNAVIKIEPNEILRGSVYPVEHRDITNKIEEIFQLSISGVPILSFADLYGGKICATLARQHPRDLFDVKLLLENEGITDEVRQAFVIYLVSSPRPIHELLNPKPTLQDMRKVYEEDFVGMTKHVVSYEELVQVRMDLIEQLLNGLTTNERQFLISIKSGLPDWSLMPISGIEYLPGLKWKSMNIEKMDSGKRQMALEKLKQVLGI